MQSNNRTLGDKYSHSLQTNTRSSTWGQRDRTATARELQGGINNSFEYFSFLIYPSRIDKYDDGDDDDRLD